MKRLLLAALFLSFSGVNAMAAAEDLQDFEAIALQPQTPKGDGGCVFQHTNIEEFGLKGSHVIALTFDDGPSEAATPAVLDVLARHRIKATFFVQGNHVAGHEELLKRISRDGHLIGNHTFSHPNLRKSEYAVAENLLREVARTHTKISPYQNSSDMLLFRAPYGNWRPARADVVNANPILRQYVGPILWNIGGAISSRGVQYGAADWDCWTHGYSPNTCAEGYMAETRREQGGVVLMHDINVKTPQMLEIFITRLKAEGYRFERLDRASHLLQQYR